VSFGDIKDFILAGHSFGGFTVGLYAIKYHHYIKKLLMLSPAGVHSKPADFNLDEELENFPAERRMPKFVYKMTPMVWKMKISPFGIMRGSGKWLAKA
jgi:pimeloyl-ACP methyl ester carboxylesterase